MTFTQLTDKELNEFLFDLQGLQIKHNVIGVPIITQVGPKIMYARLADSLEQYEKLTEDYKKLTNSLGNYEQLKEDYKQSTKDYKKLTKEYGTGK